MDTFLVTLALEYLQGKNRNERTEAALVQIIGHLASMYMLSEESQTELTRQSIAQAGTRGLL